MTELFAFGQSEQEDQVGIGFDCETCGACCAAPAAWFALSAMEADGTKELPARLVQDGKLMTDKDGRCAALQGRVGDSVRCAVYARRPLMCRVLTAGSPVCKRARAVFGLVAGEDEPDTARRLCPVAVRSRALKTGPEDAFGVSICKVVSLETGRKKEQS